MHSTVGYRDGYMHKEAAPSLLQGANALMTTARRASGIRRDVGGAARKLTADPMEPIRSTIQGRARGWPLNEVLWGPTTPKRETYPGADMSLDFGRHPQLDTPRTPSGRMQASADASIPAPRNTGTPSYDFGAHPRVPAVQKQQATPAPATAPNPMIQQGGYAAHPGSSFIPKKFFDKLKRMPHDYVTKQQAAQALQPGRSNTLGSREDIRRMIAADLAPKASPVTVQPSMQQHAKQTLNQKLKQGLLAPPRSIVRSGRNLFGGDEEGQ